MRSGGAGHSGEPAFEALKERLAQIENAVHALPETLSFRTLEDKLRTLAGVVDTLGRQEDRLGPGARSPVTSAIESPGCGVTAAPSFGVSDSPDRM
jgi:localization factor PodJL